MYQAVLPWWAAEQAYQTLSGTDEDGGPGGAEDDAQLTVVRCMFEVGGVDGLFWSGYAPGELELSVAVDVRGDFFRTLRPLFSSTPFTLRTTGSLPGLVMALPDLDGKQRCVPCSPTAYKGGGSTICTKCPALQSIAPDTPQTAPQACQCVLPATPVGITVDGHTVCSCPFGLTMIPSTQPFGFDQCRWCPPGSKAVVLAGNVTGCMACPSGTFAAAAGSLACQPCPPRSVAPPTDITDSQMLGYVISNTSLPEYTCTLCPIGFQPDADHAYCQSCPLGQHPRRMRPMSRDQSMHRGRGSGRAMPPWAGV